MREMERSSYGRIFIVTSQEIDNYTFNGESCQFIELTPNTGYSISAQMLKPVIPFIPFMTFKNKMRYSK